MPTIRCSTSLLVNHAAPERDPIDIPGVLTSALGLFALVYGFSNAETHSWTDTAKIVALVASPVLLTAFVVIEGRAKHPLLPLHFVWNRARGGAYTTIALAGAGIFAVLLFLTYPAWLIDSCSKPGCSARDLLGEFQLLALGQVLRCDGVERLAGTPAGARAISHDHASPHYRGMGADEMPTTPWARTTGRAKPAG